MHYEHCRVAGSITALFVMLPGTNSIHVLQNALQNVVSGDYSDGTVGHYYRSVPAVVPISSVIEQTAPGHQKFM